jgi:hypothetical protein
MSIDLQIVGGGLIPEVNEHIREIFGSIDPPEY